MPHRILVAKIGLDGHDRGAKVIAHALRDAGFEVIYTGLRQSADSVVAVQEDVELIGVSILSGAHVPLTAKLMAKLNEQRIHVPVVGGGTIPPGDVPALKEIGVAAVFTPDITLDDTIQAVRRLVEAS